MTMREVTVAGIRMVEASNDIVLLLADRGRQLPIWIGSPEAAAIALAQQGVQPSRPLTHDLINDVLRALGAPCERVEITRLVDGIFYADLVLTNGVRVSARPSDAVAVALRAHVPIMVADDVLDAAAITEGPQGEDAELDAFRAFLEDVSPEDFGNA
jgi:bifunctional DNase/RNase